MSNLLERAIDCNDGEHATGPSRNIAVHRTVEEYRGISYIVRDGNNFPVAYVYFESEPGRFRLNRRADDQIL
jgi:hypothetical protein